MTIPPSTPPSTDDALNASQFRITLVRVMAVQIVTLIALWLMQRHYSV